MKKQKNLFQSSNMVSLNYIYNSIAKSYNGIISWNNLVNILMYSHQLRDVGKISLFTYKKKKKIYL